MGELGGLFGGAGAVIRVVPWVGKEWGVIVGTRSHMPID